MARKDVKRYLTTGRKVGTRQVLEKDDTSPRTRRRPLSQGPSVPAGSRVPEAAPGHGIERYVARDFTGLIGMEGMSEPLLRNHFELYQGYVKNANKVLDELDELQKIGAAGMSSYGELKRRFGWEYNGVRLHELYFETLTKAPKPLPSSSLLYRRLSEDFGSYDKWLNDFRATGAIRGIGWAVLYHDVLRNRLFNAWIEQHHEGHLSGCVPILIMDVFEHAYTLDYGIKRADYIEAFLRGIQWEPVMLRLQVLIPGDVVGGLKQIPSA
jgi:superoxide dismutase, Fe-Mn family